MGMSSIVGKLLTSRIAPPTLKKQIIFDYNLVSRSWTAAVSPAPCSPLVCYKKKYIKLANGYRLLPGLGLV
jgi:hypothetical protein